MSAKRVSFHTDPKGWPSPGAVWRLRKSWHRFRAGRALRTAVAQDGWTVVDSQPNRPAGADIAVIWSWKQPKVIADRLSSGGHLLVLERGFLPPRNDWVSMSWDGFNGRGVFPGAADDGARFEQLYGHLLKPWKREDNGLVLLAGQVPGDAALAGLDLTAWAQSVTDQLVDMGLSVVYRPHPQKRTRCPKGAVLSYETLQQDLERAGRVVVYNSTLAVEAALAGVPVVALDAGSVAWPMASHALDAPLVRPDRTQWCHDLAWRQWSLNELRNGSAWRHALTQFSAASSKG